MKRLLSMIILLTITLSGLYAQAWMSQTVNIGEKHTDFDYSDTKDLRGSLSGQHPDIPGKHVIYKVRLLKSGSLFISTCYSYFLQTRVRILNTNGYEIYNSDNFQKKDPFCAVSKFAYLEANLMPVFII